MRYWVSWDCWSNRIKNKGERKHAIQSTLKLIDNKFLSILELNNNMISVKFIE